MRLPDFIIVGAQKAGTTSMHYSLANHPSIYMSDPKELSFFNIEQNRRRGLGWYASHFEAAPTDAVCGESTPNYMYDPEVPSRMSKVLPRVKLIFMLRNPIDRAYSAYWHAVRYGHEHLSFRVALDREHQRLRNGETSRKYNSYVDRGMYAQQLADFLRFYDRSQLHVMISEEYYRDRRRALAQICKFLAISSEDMRLADKTPRSENVARVPRVFFLQRLLPFVEERWSLGARALSRINLVTKPYPPMDAEVRDHLANVFKEPNAELEKLIGRDLSIWSDASTDISAECA